MKNILIMLMALISLTAMRAYAQDSPETVKIRYLIASVENLEAAKFIRNGREYDAGAAANHLRQKLKWTGSHVKTAEDFIRLCASESSVTGEPYLIRFANGTTVKAEVFFRNKLKEFVADRP